MGQIQPVPLTSSYSSLQGADRYSRECITQSPHGGITKGSFFLTNPSQNAGGIDSGIFSNWASAKRIASGNACVHVSGLATSVRWIKCCNEKLWALGLVWR